MKKIAYVAIIVVINGTPLTKRMYRNDSRTPARGYLTESVN
jgi:hypothetical protein